MQTLHLRPPVTSHIGAQTLWHGRTPTATPGMLFPTGGNVTLRLRGLVLGCFSLRLPPQLCSAY